MYDDIGELDHALNIYLIGNMPTCKVQQFAHEQLQTN